MNIRIFLSTTKSPYLTGARGRINYLLQSFWIDRGLFFLQQKGSSLWLNGLEQLSKSERILVIKGGQYPKFLYRFSTKGLQELIEKTPGQIMAHGVIERRGCVK